MASIYSINLGYDTAHQHRKMIALSPHRSNTVLADCTNGSRSTRKVLKSRKNRNYNVNNTRRALMALYIEVIVITRRNIRGIVT